MKPDAFVDWLANSDGSVALHESLYMYTFIETAHVIGIMLFVGSIAMVDLRLLGLAFKATPISQMNSRILPWTVAGFVLMLVTGVLLFYAIPVRTWHSIWFRLKVVFFIAAAINIFVFHWKVERGRDAWDLASKPPLAARVSATVSLLLWIGVVVTGRMIAYNWFDCDKPQPPLVSALASCSTQDMEIE